MARPLCFEAGQCRPFRCRDTALALTNHDKESFNFGVMAELSVLPHSCAVG